MCKRVQHTGICASNVFVLEYFCNIVTVNLLNLIMPMFLNIENTLLLSLLLTYCCCFTYFSSLRMCSRSYNSFFNDYT